MFYSIQHMNGWSAASDVFDMFTQSIKLYYPFGHVLRVQMFEKCLYQIDSKNRWLLLPASFTAKFGLVFVLTLKKSFHFQANRKSLGSSKK